MGGGGGKGGEGKGDGMAVDEKRGMVDMLEREKCRLCKRKQTTFYFLFLWVRLARNINDGKKFRISNIAQQT